MAERSLYQYAPLVGPVWREPVAEKLAWLPGGSHQPARSLPPNRLGDFTRPEFEALYRPERLEWVPADRYAGRAIPFSLRRDFSLDPLPPNARFPDWLPGGQQPARGVAWVRLGDFSQPALDALYKPEGLQWAPGGRQPPRWIEPGKLGDFVQPPFDALYKAEGLQWSPSDVYGRKPLARGQLPEYSALVQLVVQAFDPRTLDWVPSGAAPRVAGELRRLGDFQQPAFDSLYKPEELGWQPRGRAEPAPPETRRLGDFQQPPFAGLFKPEGLQWSPSAQQPARSAPQPRVGDFSRPEFEALYKPERLEWQAKDSYAGRAQSRAAYDYSVLVQLVSAAAYDPQTLEWLARATYPQAPVERRILGDFQQPAFQALFKPEQLQWFPSERYAGRSPARALNDWSVLVQLVTAPVFDPQTLEWQARDTYYSGRSLARALVDWSVYQGEPIAQGPQLPPSVKFGRQFPRKPRGLAFVPNKAVPQIVPRETFAAEVESQVRFDVEISVAVQVVASCSIDTVATYASEARPYVRLDGNADVELDRRSAAGTLSGSAAYSAEYGFAASSSAKPDARAEATADPRNKRPLSDGEILAALEAISRRPKKK